MTGPGLDTTLAALADPHRRAIVDMLRGDALLPSEIAERLAITRPLTSRHLRALRRAGLIAQEVDEQDARSRPVRLRPEPFAELRGWLEEVEDFWADQLQAFKVHAESPSRRRPS